MAIDLCFACTDMAKPHLLEGYLAVSWPRDFRKRRRVGGPTAPNPYPPREGSLIPTCRVKRG
jgi:hypothetical protein